MGNSVTISNLESTDPLGDGDYLPVGQPNAHNSVTNQNGDTRKATVGQLKNHILGNIPQQIVQLNNDTAELGEGISREEAARKTTDEDLQTQVNRMKCIGGFLPAFDFGQSPEQEELTQYVLDQIGLTEYLGIWNGTKLKNLHDEHVWILKNTPAATPPVFEWTDNGPDGPSGLYLVTESGGYLVTA